MMLYGVDQAEFQLSQTVWQSICLYLSLGNPVRERSRGVVVTISEFRVDTNSQPSVYLNLNYASTTRGLRHTVSSHKA